MNYKINGINNIEKNEKILFHGYSWFLIGGHKNTNI